MCSVWFILTRSPRLHWYRLCGSAATSCSDYPNRVHLLIRATPSVNVTWLRFSIFVRDVFLKIFQRKNKSEKQLKIKLLRIILFRDSKHTHCRSAHRACFRWWRRLRCLNFLRTANRQQLLPGWVKIFVYHSCYISWTCYPLPGSPHYPAQKQRWVTLMIQKMHYPAIRQKPPFAFNPIRMIATDTPNLWFTRRRKVINVRGYNLIHYRYYQI